MDNAESRIEAAEKDIQHVEADINYFEKMVEGADRLIKPWKFALILTNLFWAVVLAAFIAFAYLTPTEMEQSQDFPGQQQEQTIKGVN